jgi:hypothetical protein
LEPFPVDSTFRELESRLIAIEIFCQVFIARPPAEEHFFESFDNFFRKLLTLLESNSRIDLIIHTFRCAVKILEGVRYKFHDAPYIDYWACLVDSSSKQILLRQMILRLMPANIFCDFPMVRMGRIILENDPDPASIWAVANAISIAKTPGGEKPLCVIQSLAILSVKDEILARTCCKALSLLVQSSDRPIPWLVSFLKKATGFVIVAQHRRVSPYQVGLVFELFCALFTTQVAWLQSEISMQAAILLGSQKVPMAIVNSLKPAVRYETADLHQWVGDTVRTLDLNTIFLSVKEEPVPRLPCAILRDIVPQRRAGKIGSISLSSFPTTNSVISQRAKAKRSPAKPVVKTTRIAQLSIRH